MQSKKKEGEKEARRKEKEELERQKQAARRCDELAANPTDPKRTVDGVPYELLAPQAADAIEACTLALKQLPDEPRLQYQLARALQANNQRARAFELHKKLIQAKYPAAFDNAGWLYVTERKDYVTAVRLFRRGSELGDPDSMVSLAEMIDRGYFIPGSVADSKLTLLSRAAELGHPGAVRALQAEEERERRGEQQRAIDREQSARMMQFFGRMIQNFPQR